MICQSCGKCIIPHDIYIVKFEGRFLPIKATWIACDSCTDKLVADIVNIFPPEILKSVDIHAYKNRRDKRK